MNATEAAFAQDLELRRAAGEVLWWCYEGVKLKLADNTHLTIDFPVMMADGILRMIDVKGARHLVTEDARVKMKVAAEKFPFIFEIAYPVGGVKRREWVREEI